jgi:hypothetical protein
MRKGFGGGEMRQRGRRSAAAILIEPHINGEPSRLTAPRSLTNGERSAFIELVDACSAEHFRESDKPLLIAYVQAQVMAMKAVHDQKKVAVWEKAVRVQAMLATRLRLSPQSRADRKTIARQQLPHEGPEPWEDDQ